MATTLNYPEMHGNIENDLQAEYISFLGKYRVTSKNEIEVKQGIVFNSVVAEFGANHVKNKNQGWFKYYFTPKAFYKFQSNNHIILNRLLD